MKTEKELIYLAMGAIMRDMDAIQKERTNQQQGFKFRGIEDCYNALHPIMAAHGVICLPVLEKHETSSPGVNSKGNAIYRSTVVMSYRFTATDGSFVEAKTAGDAFDFADKSMAKSMSVAHKYALLQTFLIPTGDVEDADYYSPTVMPREELARIAEERAKATVLAGGEMDLPPEQAEALRQKRESMTGELPEGATRVQETMLPPVEKGDEPAHPVKPDEQPASRRGRKKADAPSVETPKSAATSQPTKNAEGWRAYVITQITMQEYQNKPLGELTSDQIKFLKEKWADKYAEKIKLNPAKSADAEQIRVAYAELFPG